MTASDGGNVVRLPDGSANPALTLVRGYVIAAAQKQPIAKHVSVLRRLPQQPSEPLQVWWDRLREELRFHMDATTRHHDPVARGVAQANIDTLLAEVGLPGAPRGDDAA